MLIKVIVTSGQYMLDEVDSYSIVSKRLWVHHFFCKHSFILALCVEILKEGSSVGRVRLFPCHSYGLPGSDYTVDYKESVDGAPGFMMLEKESCS